MPVHDYIAGVVRCLVSGEVEGKWGMERVLYIVDLSSGNLLSPIFYSRLCYGVEFTPHSRTRGITREPCLAIDGQNRKPAINLKVQYKAPLLSPSLVPQLIDLICVVLRTKCIASSIRHGISLEWWRCRLPCVASARLDGWTCIPAYDNFRKPYLDV